MEKMEETNPQESGACAPQISRLLKQVASAIRQTADTLSLPREAESGEPNLDRLGIQTRAWIEAAADRIEKINPVKIKNDFSGRVQRNPGASLLTAAAVGLIFGIFIVRRR